MFLFWKKCRRAFLMTHLSNVGKHVLWMTSSFHLCGSVFGSLSECLLVMTLSLFDNRIQVRRLIKESAVYEKRSTYRRCCWYVHADVLSRHSQDALPVPCQWTYLTSGAQITREEPAGSQGNSPTSQSTSTTPSNKRKSASSHSITKYMKKCGESEQVWETKDKCKIEIRFKTCIFYLTLLVY